MKLVGYSDGSFETNRDGSSQVGYLTFMAHKNHNDNPIEYASKKSRRLFRSVLGAETFVQGDACDSAVFIQHDSKQIVGKRLNIKLLTDSKTFFIVIIRKTLTTKTFLIIYVNAAI